MNLHETFVIVRKVIHKILFGWSFKSKLLVYSKSIFHQLKLEKL